MLFRTIAVSLLVGCATTAAPVTTTSPGGERGLRASEHLEAARDQDAVARSRTAWPEHRPMDGVGEPDDGARGTLVASDSTDHVRLASVHRSGAAQLEADYDEACGSTPSTAVLVSPLKRFGIGGTQRADGIVMYLSPDAGTPEAVLAEMRCHRAWMMMAPTDTSDSVLDLPGITMAAQRDTNGIEVTITIHDKALLPELQRRAAHDLEAAAALRRSHEQVSGKTPARR